jgi:hypothetical protein
MLEIWLTLSWTLPESRERTVCSVWSDSSLCLSSMLASVATDQHIRQIWGVIKTDGPHDEGDATHKG